MELECNQEGKTVILETIDKGNLEKGNRKKKSSERYGNWLSCQAKKIEKSQESNLEAMVAQIFVKENVIIPDSFNKAKETDG